MSHVSVSPLAPAFIKARIGDAWRDREGYVVDDEFLRLGLAEEEVSEDSFASCHVP